MIIAPYVFDIDQDGRYTTDVVTDWVHTNGEATVLHPGRILRYTDAGDWEVTMAKSLSGDTTWKPLDKAAKTIKEHFAEAEVPAEPRLGYYELIDPEAATDTFTTPPPRTSLYALQKWVPTEGVPGILWSWEPDESSGRQFAVVRAEHLSE